MARRPKPDCICKDKKSCTIKGPHYPKPEVCKHGNVNCLQCWSDLILRRD